MVWLARTPQDLGTCETYEQGNAVFVPAAKRSDGLLQRSTASTSHVATPRPSRGRRTAASFAQRAGRGRTGRGSGPPLKHIKTRCHLKIKRPGEGEGEGEEKRVDLDHLRKHQAQSTLSSPPLAHSSSAAQLKSIMPSSETQHSSPPPQSSQSTSDSSPPPAASRILLDPNIHPQPFDLLRLMDRYEEGKKEDEDEVEGLLFPWEERGATEEDAGADASRSHLRAARGGRRGVYDLVILACEDRGRAILLPAREDESGDCRGGGEAR